MAVGDKKPVVMEADRAVPGGIATLGTDGKLSSEQIPDMEALGAIEYINSLPFTRKNLLDNWYFADPINQRGSSEYIQTGYAIDRWTVGTTAGTDIGPVRINDGYLSIDATGGNARLNQVLEKYHSGKKVCLSVLTTRGLYSANLTIGSTAAGTDMTIAKAYSVLYDGFPYVVLEFKSGDTYDLIAAKLELGSTQTLAHQDENGNWVLNEIPDYGEQLAKCQRYQNVMTVRIKAGGVEEWAPYPVSMRATPNTIVLESEGGFTSVSTANQYGLNLTNSDTAFSRTITVLSDANL